MSIEQKEIESLIDKKVNESIDKELSEFKKSLYDIFRTKDDCTSSMGTLESKIDSLNINFAGANVKISVIIGGTAIVIALLGAIFAKVMEFI